MADIKERKKDTGSIKEKRTSIPKELLKQETIHSIQWARQQVQEAAEPESQENEEAGAGMPRRSVPQIKSHSRPQTKQAVHDPPTATEQSAREFNIMSTKVKGESAPSRVSAVKSIGALLGSSAGLVAVLLVMIVLAAGLLLSPLGIFFSGDAGGDVTLQQVMSELNTAFSDRITEIENTNAHDDLRQDGQRPLWKDILTIYAVKTTTDPENPLDAVSMDEEHAEVLRTIFWDMTVTWQHCVHH